MKRIAIVMVALAAIVLPGCQKTAQTGRLSFALEEGEVMDVQTKGNVSDYAAIPSEGDFTLTLKSGASIFWTGLLSEWNGTKEIEAGKYTAEVSYGSAEDEGYSKPCFAGKADFTVTGGQTCYVQIPVSLGNAIVKISCTDAFKSYYTSYSFTITTGAGNVFENVSGPVFMDAYKFTVTGNFTAQSGKAVSMAPVTKDVEAATCYNMVFDATNVGSVTVTISFDDTVQTVEFEQDLNE